MNGLDPATLHCSVVPYWALWAGQVAMPQATAVEVDGSQLEGSMPVYEAI